MLVPSFCRPLHNLLSILSFHNLIFNWHDIVTLKLLTSRGAIDQVNANGNDICIIHVTVLDFFFATDLHLHKCKSVVNLLLCFSSSSWMGRIGCFRHIHTNIWDDQLKLRYWLLLVFRKFVSVEKNVVSF